MSDRELNIYCEKNVLPSVVDVKMNAKWRNECSESLRKGNTIL